MPVDIILADNHPLFRKGTGLVLESNPDINLVAEAENGGDLIEKCRKFNPNIVILDLKMPGMSGVEILKVLSNEFPGTSIIVLSMVEIINSIFEVISAGAKAYVLKSSDVGEILNAITSVQKNEVYYCEGTEQLLSGFIQRDFNKGMKKNKIEFSKVDSQLLD
ncbi:MAG: DNA-binding response regulator [Chitinophagaceae bacterium]|nr:DNA-binding response regulator [Chitinophagaceae bacterium]